MSVIAEPSCWNLNCQSSMEDTYGNAKDDTRQISQKDSDKKKGFIRKSFRRLSRRHSKLKDISNESIAHSELTSSQDNISEFLESQMTCSCPATQNYCGTADEIDYISKSCVSESALSWSTHMAFTGFKRKLSGSFRRLKRQRNTRQRTSTCSSPVEKNARYDSDVCCHADLSKITPSSSFGSVFEDVSVESIIDDLDRVHRTDKSHWDYSDSSPDSSLPANMHNSFNYYLPDNNVVNMSEPMNDKKDKRQEQQQQEHNDSQLKQEKQCDHQQQSQQRKQSLQEKGKQSLQEERKQSLQEEGQQSLQEERKQSLQEERKQWLQEERKQSLQEERKQSLQEERKQSPQEERKQSLQEERKESLQQERQQSLQQERQQRRHQVSEKQQTKLCRWKLGRVSKLDLKEHIVFLLVEEYTYCQALEAVCNPLGVPDTREGYSPAALADHVQQIFKIDPDTHKRCLRAVQHSKPSNVCLCVTVEEARDLKPYNTNEICDPYCVVQIKSQNRNVTPKSSPQVSPKSQRRCASPTQVARRHSSIRPDNQIGLKETHTIKGTSKPHWNTEFEIPITDIQNDELCVYIWDDNINSSDTDSIQKHTVTRNRHSLRNLFRHFHKLSGEKLDGCLGQFKVSLKDIPVLGVDRWYDLYEDSKNKKRTAGQCKLKLQLTARPSSDRAESDQCSSEDFFSLTQRVYRHAMEQLVHDTDQDEDRPLLKQLSTKSRMVLDQFAAQNHFTILSQNITELSTLLEMYCDDQRLCRIADTLIRDIIDSADMLWTNKQKQNRCHEIHGIVANRELFCKTEVSLLEQMTMLYLNQTTETLIKDNTFPKTFPPIEITVGELKGALGFSKHLLSFLHKLSNTSTHNKLTDVLKDRIQADCQTWWGFKLQCIKSVDKDAVISEAKIFTGVVTSAIEHCSPGVEVSQYFIEFNINYEKTVIVYLEKKISSKAQEVMLRMDSYQKNFLRHRPNILESSIVCQALYSVLRKFVTITKSHFTMRDLYRITMISYQDWFKKAVTYWLQTFREEGIRRVTKALDIEKDVVQVTEGVKISNSAVDVVANLHMICTEWKAIEFTDADISLLAATKITELICDGLTGYLEKIERILENNGYYDFIDNCVFDVTDQLCITLNNIVHVIHYIQKLPELLEWNKVCQNMSVKYEDESIGQRCLATLQRLIRTTQEELICRAKALWNKVTDLMEKDLEHYIISFTQCQSGKLSGVDALLDYLKTNLEVFDKKLDSFIMPSVVENLWNRAIATLTNNLMEGQHPDYYRRMHNHLESLYAYFAVVGLTANVRECTNFCELVDTLTLHYTPTSELMLQYYHSLNNPPQSPAAYFGHLEVKVAYQVDPNAKVNDEIQATMLRKSLDQTDNVDNNNAEADTVANVFVNVLRAKSLPAMTDKSEATNPFVSLALCPMTFFPISRHLKTPKVKGTVNPVFDVTYQYQGIPLSLLQREGATLLLTVWHSESYLPCHHFLGEVVIPLNVIPALDPHHCIEDIPATICPLTRPEEPTTGPFKVLAERQSWDKMAREMVTHRKCDTGMTTVWPLCRPMNYFLSVVRAGQSTKVKGQPRLSAPVL